MTDAFADLKSEYEKLWATTVIRPERAATVEAIAKRLIDHKATLYAVVERATGVPWYVIAALHNRESDADFDTYLGNGEPLDRETRLVPRGRGPFDTWEEGAIDALKVDGLDQVAAVGEWTSARACYEIEKFNGFGYRNNHPDVKSPYLWSFTNHYKNGKYTSDGQFDYDAVDKQCGAIPVMKRLMELSGVKTGAPAVKESLNTGGGWLSALINAIATMFRSAPAKAPELPADDLASRLVAAMKRHNYTLFTGPGETNTIYAEGMSPEGIKNDNAPNEFNDARFVIGFESAKPQILGAWQATTEPSRYWTEHRMNAAGAARVKFGQYAAWQLGDHHGHEALVQTGGKVTVCRDNNEDFRRDGDTEDTGFFGVNQHWGYDLPKDDLGRSSAGCLVGRMRKGHEEFMALMKSDPRFVANNRFVFTAAVLPASEV